MRRFGVALVALNLAVSLWAAASTSALAQSWEPPQTAYTSADPVRPDALGLALPTGRWAISKADDCDAIGLAPGENVLFWLLQGFSSAGTVGLPDAQGVVQMCNVRLEQLMDPTPCFTNASGDCDVAAEQ